MSNSLHENIEAIEAVRAQNALSLNLEQRRREREERKIAELERENVRREARGLELIESLDELDDDEKPDVLLDQAKRIVTDLVSLRGTAQPVITQATGS